MWGLQSRCFYFCHSFAYSLSKTRSAKELSYLFSCDQNMYSLLKWPSCYCVRWLCCASYIVLPARIHAGQLNKIIHALNFRLPHGSPYWIWPFCQNHVVFHTKWRIWKSNPKRHQVHMLEHASLNLWSWHKWHKSGNISWLLPLYITENKKENFF